MKPDFFTDEKLAECSIPARLMFIGMWVFADDAGRMEYSPKRLKMQIFPGDDNIDTGLLLGELEKIGCVVRYNVAGHTYLQITNFSKHQKISHAYPSKLPERSISIPVPFTERSRNDTGTFWTDVDVDVDVDKELSSKPKVGLDGFAEALKEVWDYYLKTTDRNGNLYKLTKERKQKGLARLKECFGIATEPKLPNAVSLMKICIDRISQSEFHNGKNQNGKSYIDWSNHLFPNENKLTWWLDDSNHQTKKRKSAVAS